MISQRVISHDCCSRRVNFNNPFKREEFLLPKLDEEFSPYPCGRLLTHRYAMMIGEQKPFSLEFEIISARRPYCLSA